MKPAMLIFAILFGLYAMLRSFGVDPLAVSSTAPVTINGVPVEMDDLEFLMNEAEKMEDFDLSQIQDIDLAQVIEERKSSQTSTD